MNDLSDKARIFIVEDEVLVAEDLAARLKNLNYRVCGQARSGEQALEKIAAVKPDLVLMDIFLKGDLDGIETAARLRDISGPPVVFLTAYSDGPILERVKQTTPYGYILKPITNRVLALSLEMAIHSAKINTEKALAEQNLRKTNRLFNLLRNVNQTIIRRRDRQDLLEEVCRIVVRDGGYGAACVLLADENGDELEISACSGGADGLAHDLSSSLPKADPQNPDPLPILLASGRPYILPDLEDDSEKPPCFRAAAGAGFGSAAAFALPADDRLRGAFIFFASEKNHFDREEAELLDELARDLSFALDVSEREEEKKRLEQAFKQSEALRLRLADEAPDMIFRISLADGSYQYVNPASTNITGWRPEEFYSNPFLIRETIHPDWRGYLEEQWSLLLQGQAPPFYEYKIVDKSGQEKWLNQRNHLIRDEQGRPIALEGVVTDVSERKRLEQMLLAGRKNLSVTLDSIGDGVIVTDPEGRVTRMNPVAEELTGWSRTEAAGVLLNEVFNIVNMDTRLPVENPVAKVIREGRIVGLANHTVLIAKDGREFPIDDSGAPIKDEDGGLMGVVLVFRDVSDQVRSARALRSIEWLLDQSRDALQGGAPPPYGDLTELNQSGLIADSIEKSLLTDIAGDYLKVLGSSSAIYEKDGAYALGIFSSGYCSFLDQASRKLSPSEDNQEALDSGRWLCHESCWTDCSLKAIETGSPVDIECHGGIRLFALPIRSGGEIIGAINFGYGDPPRDQKKIQEIAGRYRVDPKELLKHALNYESRPPYLIEIAKQRLKTSARLIGEIVERKQAEKALKESEAQQREILANAPVGIGIVQNRRIVFANRVISEMLGYEPGELVGHEARVLYPTDEDYAYVAEKKLPDLMKLGTAAIDARFVRKNGQILDVMMSTNLIRNKGGDYEAVSTVTDITARKRDEARLQNTLHEKEVLLKELHHRVKNNMQVIISLMNMQMHAFDDPRLTEAFQESQNRILAMAAVHETLHQSENLAAIDLARYLENLCSTIFQSYRIGPVELKLKFSAEPIELKLEKSYPIGLVVNELFSNSLKYAFEPGQKGTVSLGAESLSTDLIKLTVADDGRGLPPDLDWRNSKALGLNIVRTLVEDQLEGSIEMEKDSGSRFIITFPL